MTAPRTNITLIVFLTGLSTAPQDLPRVEKQSIILPEAQSEKKPTQGVPSFVLNYGSGYNYEASLKLLKEYRIFKDIYQTKYQEFIKNEEKNKAIALHLLEKLYEEKKKILYTYEVHYT